MVKSPKLVSSPKKFPFGIQLKSFLKFMKRTSERSFEWDKPRKTDPFGCQNAINYRQHIENYKTKYNRKFQHFYECSLLRSEVTTFDFRCFFYTNPKSNFFMHVAQVARTRFRCSQENLRRWKEKPKTLRNLYKAKLR